MATEANAILGTTGERLVHDSLTSAEAGPQLPWYEWYPSDFSGNYIVQAMTVSQELGYRRLLDAAWTSRTPCFLPNSPQFLAAVARMSELQWGSDGRIVLEMFVVTQDGNHIYHPKQYDIYQRSRRVWEARHRGALTRAGQLKKDTTHVTTHATTRGTSPAPVVTPVVHVTTTTTTTTKEQLKPSARTAQPDPRFQPFVDLLDKYWKFKNPEVPFTFGGPDGKALKSLLKNQPSLSEDTFANCLRHRARSDVVHTESPMAWLPHIMLYAAGPIDRYGKPQGSESNGSNRKSPARERADRILETGRVVESAIQQRIEEAAITHPAGIDSGGAVDLGGGAYLVPDRGGSGRA